MTNIEIVQMHSGLINLRAQADLRFPARVSFAILHNMKILEPIIESYEAARMELVHRHGQEVPEQPGAYQIHEGQVEEFSKEFDALNKIENEVTLTKIKMSDIEDIQLSVDNVAALYPMIEEEG